ncbi:MAG: NUDIX domain-containing protein [Candidatus Falkowbacteria bacterium]
MMRENEIRVLAIAVIRSGKQILVSPGRDKVKGEDFYRLPGGGIDFGELSRDGLAREIEEEFGAKLVNVKFLKVVENVFTFNEMRGHEICFVYQADFADQALYKKIELEILDTPGGKALWVDMDKLGLVYPQGALDHLE